MLIHFLCSIFLAAFLFELYTLINLNFMRRWDIMSEFIYKQGIKNFTGFEDYKGPFVNGEERNNYYLWTALLYMAGLVIAFIIFFIFSIKRKLSWINSFIVLIVSLSLMFLKIENTYSIRIIPHFPTYFFHMDIEYHIILNTLLYAFLLFMIIWKGFKFINRIEIKNDSEKIVSAEID